MTVFALFLAPGQYGDESSDSPAAAKGALFKQCVIAELEVAQRPPQQKEKVQVDILLVWQSGLGIRDRNV